MKTAFARLWSIVRGDKYMADAYAPQPEDADIAPAESAERAPADPPPTRER